jgi:predicted kinase
MPTLYMMIGIPGSGKSTWLAKQAFDWARTRIISTDNIIDQRAAAQGKTYSDVFQKEIKSATSEMNQQLKAAIAAGDDIVWDQTNLTKKSRAGKLSQIPEEYHKVAVVFRTPDDVELTKRLANRPGKHIPPNVLLAMKSQLEMPTSGEGFDEIIHAS